MGRLAGLIAAAFAIIALAAAYALLRPSSSGEGGGMLRVANQKGQVKALMIASGVLDDVPYRVEWSEFPAAQPLLEALGSGAVDLGLAGDAPFIFAYLNGSPIRAVAAQSMGATTRGALSILVRKSSLIRSVKDLVGHSIATTRGSIGHHLILQALEAEGVPVETVRIIFLPPGDAKAAFDSGSIDAWSTWGPYTSVAVKEGARIVADGSAFGPYYSLDAASDAALASRRPLIDDFVRREAEALVWAKAHPDDYAKVLAKETGLPLDVAQSVVASGNRTPHPIDNGLVAREAEIAARFEKGKFLVTKRPISEAFILSGSATAR